MCAHNQIFTPAVQRAKELLTEHNLGRIYEIRTVDAFRLSWDTGNIGWRGKKETMGGGELIDTGYHPSYLLLYLADSIPIEVAGMLSTYRLHSLEGEDSAQVLVRFADGSLGNIVTSWAYDPPPGNWRFQIIGERGHISGWRNHLHYRINGGELEKIALPEVNAFNAEIAHFVACLRNKQTPVQTELDGIRALKVILAAYQSQIEKRIVALHPEQ
jgi:predicted dehydrogenase